MSPEIAEFRGALETACLNGLHLTEWGHRYSPSMGADAVTAMLRQYVTSEDVVRRIAERQGLMEADGTIWTDRCEFIAITLSDLVDVVLPPGQPDSGAR